MRLAVLILAVTIAGPASAALHFHWEDRFTPAERAKLEAWIRGTQAAVETLVGAYRFDVHVRVHRRDGAGEPVPWAHTFRERPQGVDFHVDPSYSLRELRADWTAPHELSHLILPYLGRRASWFAEGFASYMQYQVMRAMGELSAAEAAGLYRDHLRRAERRYRYDDRPFAEAAPRLRAEGKYPVMYWGGAAYFLRVDARLRRSDASLLEVLREYLACCRSGSGELDALVTALDRVAGSEAFSAQLARFRTVRGFPDYDDKAS